jgi:hypothetical protein
MRLPTVSELFVAFSSLLPARRRPVADPRPRRARPSVEPLEGRSLPSASQALQAAYGHLPLAFEANQGQAPSQIDYMARGPGYSLSLTAQQAVLALSQGNAGNVVGLRLVGANPSAPVVSLDQLITRTNYLIGNDPSQWHTNIANFGRVEYQGVYRGIDLVYYGNQGQLEYDFVVAPEANPGAVRLAVQGTQSMALDARGNLVLHTSGGDIIEQAPVIYQMVGGVRKAVSGRFVLEGNNQVGFQVGAYDHSRPLVIDPVLSYSTYLGGSSAADGLAIAVDASGGAYITGRVVSGAFPTTPGAFQSSGGAAFVTKLNATGTALVYSTYLGPSALGVGIAVDGSGDAYVTGTTTSSIFPTTPNSFETAGSGGFATVLNPSGSGLIYSTYITGMMNPGVNIPAGAIAVDGSGNLYVTGRTNGGMTTTPTAYESVYRGTGGTMAFLVGINPALSGPASLIYGSYLGGTQNGGPGWGSDYGTGIAVDGAGGVYLTGSASTTDFPTTAGAFQRTLGGGSDAFVAKFNTSLSGAASLLYSTYLGGSGNDGFSWDGAIVYDSYQKVGPGIAVDGAGNAYVAGVTRSTNFPTTPGAIQAKFGGDGSGTTVGLGDAFVTKLNATGTALVYSTYLGGANGDGATSIAVDASGNADVTGWTRSTNFPTMNPLQAKKASGTVDRLPASDVFVTTLNASGTGLLFSTYLGGTGDDYGYGIALDPHGNAYVTGFGNYYGTGFPTTPGAYRTTSNTGYAVDAGAFVFEIDPPAGGAAAPSEKPAPHSPAHSSGSHLGTTVSSIGAVASQRNQVDLLFALLSDHATRRKADGREA